MSNSVSFTQSDYAAAKALVDILNGIPLNGLAEHPEPLGVWGSALVQLNGILIGSGRPAVRQAFAAQLKAYPDLAVLQKLASTGGVMEGATREALEILEADGRQLPYELPFVDSAESLVDLAEFVNRTLVIPKFPTREKKRAVACVIGHLLLGQGRLLVSELDNSPYVVADDNSVWPLSDETAATLVMLNQAGLNASESAFEWVLNELQCLAVTSGRQVTFRQFFHHEAGPLLYVSCGPSAVIRGRLDGEEVRLELLSNGTDDIWFRGADALPEWNHEAAALDPLTLSPFVPCLVTPPEVPAYTPEVQRLLFRSWLIGLIADVRPIPMVSTIGDRGGGKSQVVRSLSVLFMEKDPTALQDDQRNMEAQAVHTPILALDNVDSNPPPWFADFIAALVTHVDLERRKMYTNTQVEREKMPAVPVISTRTASFARPDVAERLLPLSTGQFAENGVGMLADSELDKLTRDNRDGVLVWLAKQAVISLTRMNQAPPLPGRFVEFAQVVWVQAEPGSQDARAALTALRQAQHLSVGDADPLIAAVIEYAPRLCEGTGHWSGTPSELVRSLQVQGANLSYPQGGKVIAQKLRESSGTLILFGIKVVERRQGNATIFVLTYKAQQ